MPTHIASTEDEIIDAVKTAREWNSPLEIMAGGSKQRFGRAVTTMGSVLDVAGLSGIVSYEPEELILTVKPGTTLAEIEAVLAEKNQRLGFEPADWGPVLGVPGGYATIGGAISADSCGPARVRYGAARDHLLGVRAVNGLGEAFKGGGKVVKNVTGFDVPKLVCGAMGTLCVLTEVTLRVFPKPPLSVTTMVRGLSTAEGAALLRKVWSSPLEATGLAFSRGNALIRLEGEQGPLAEKCAALRTLIGAQDVMEVPEGEIVFRAIGSGEVFVDEPYDVWRVFVPPASAAAVADEIDAPLWLADWAGGLLWVGVLPGSDAVRAVANKHGGTATLLRAEEETRETLDVFEPQDPARLDITKRVKAAFDPQALFNPGRMWDGV
ncbi:MAG: glycolate oxidase subunit GlcE [Alphaproteobacteria bacterium]|nr:glycolate oxidase subunit GlcE [Alphaproteobacteria bacterium]MBV9542565.1 glycolate oxidase subunit GlcE [Alphaproteobacteria bacterium]MBV9904502.1 glycolate oxidase subunit GlcE [Alphaproteobacteria bacterium]